MLTVRTSVQDRVLASEFFLETARARMLEPDPFRWSIEAFMVFTRSIPELIEGEYETRPGWRAWWEPRLEALEADALWAQFYEFRNRSSHHWVLTPKDLGDPERVLRAGTHVLELSRDFAEAAINQWEGSDVGETVVDPNVYCSNCGGVLAVDADESPRTPCPECAALARTRRIEISDSARGSAVVAYAARHPGEKQAFLWGSTGDSWSRKLQRWVQRGMVFDRAADRYKEEVSDPLTGEIIHSADEPLSEHRGHGSARMDQRPRTPPKRR